MMTSYLLLIFFTNGNKALQHDSKKCTDHKRTMWKNKTICSHSMKVYLLAYELFRRPTNLSIDLSIYLSKEGNIYIHIVICNDGRVEVRCGDVIKTHFDLIVVDSGK